MVKSSICLGTGSYDPFLLFKVEEKSTEGASRVKEVDGDGGWLVMNRVLVICRRHFYCDDAARIMPGRGCEGASS